MSNFSIMIIDDDEVDRYLLKRILNKVGTSHQIFEADNGKTALDFFSRYEENTKKYEGKFPPLLVFLDINMPIMDGWGFLDELISLDLKEHIIINMITSSIDPLDHQKWSNFKDRCPYALNFKNKPIFKIEAADLGLMDMAS